MLYDGRPWHTELRNSVGFVEQDDIVFSSITVRQSLCFTARLRLPRAWSLSRKLARVETVIHSLNLGRCADTVISNVSGGERKRLCIAAESLVQPRLLLLDEPTSGAIYQFRHVRGADWESGRAWRRLCPGPCAQYLGSLPTPLTHEVMTHCSLTLTHSATHSLRSLGHSLALSLALSLSHPRGQALTHRLRGMWFSCFASWCIPRTPGWLTHALSLTRAPARNVSRPTATTLFRLFRLLILLAALQLALQ